MTEPGKALLFEHEGQRLEPYQDSLGNWTIGVGHLLNGGPHERITVERSHELFFEDVSKAEAECWRVFPWFGGLDQVRQDALINLMFNMGATRLLGFKRTLAAIERGDWIGAAFELSNSLWARQVQKTRKDDLCNALEFGTWRV
jgi:lysozyme